MRIGELDEEDPEAHAVDHEEQVAPAILDALVRLEPSTAAFTAIVVTTIVVKVGESTTRASAFRSATAAILAARSAGTCTRRSPRSGGPWRLIRSLHCAG